MFCGKTVIYVDLNNVLTTGKNVNYSLFGNISVFSSKAVKVVHSDHGVSIFHFMYVPSQYSPSTFPNPFSQSTQFL